MSSEDEKGTSTLAMLKPSKQPAHKKNKKQATAGSTTAVAAVAAGARARVGDGGELAAPMPVRSWPSQTHTCPHLCLSHVPFHTFVCHAVIWQHTAQSSPRTCVPSSMLGVCIPALGM